MGSLVSTPGKGYGSGSELVFCYLDSKRISEELLTGAAHPVFKMGEDGNEQVTVAEDNGVEPDLVDLMMDDDEFDVTIERMVSLSPVGEYTETTGDKDTRIISLHPVVAFCDRARAKQSRKRDAVEQAICFLSHAFPECSRNFKYDIRTKIHVRLTNTGSIFEFGRLIRSHSDCCFHYIEKPLEFGNDSLTWRRNYFLYSTPFASSKYLGLNLSQRRLKKGS